MTTDMAARGSLIKSVAIMNEYHWIFLRHLHAGVSSRLGQDGLAALGRGLWRYGYSRGVFIRDSPATIVDGRAALSIIRHWDAGELGLGAARGPANVVVTAGSATIALPSAPGSDYFSGQGASEALGLHWHHVLAGMAAGFGEGVTVESDPVVMTPWTFTWHHPSIAADDNVELEDIFASPGRYIELGRRTTGLIAALQMYCSMELIDIFDAAGEEVVREAAFAFGAERGAALRDRHLAEGIPINLQTMSQTLAERDPLEALFSIRGHSYSSPGLSQFDCTYCPLADIWASEGSEGLKLGYLFDMELHRGLVESFHPGAIVRWDALKTRGDAVCRFRFSIPELVTPAEASLVGPAPRRPGSVGPPGLD